MADAPAAGRPIPNESIGSEMPEALPDKEATLLVLSLIHICRDHKLRRKKRQHRADGLHHAGEYAAEKWPTEQMPSVQICRVILNRFFTFVKFGAQILNIIKRRTNTNKTPYLLNKDAMLFFLINVHHLMSISEPFPDQNRCVQA